MIGCTEDPDNSARTVDCPTTGLDEMNQRVIITIEGLYFGNSDALVKIGSKPCTDVRHDTNSPTEKLTCVLPVNNGAKQDIVVSRGLDLFSHAKDYLDYSAPVIDSITGCIADGMVSFLSVNERRLFPLAKINAVLFVVGNFTKDCSRTGQPLVEIKVFPNLTCPTFAKCLQAAFICPCPGLFLWRSLRKGHCRWRCLL